MLLARYHENRKLRVFLYLVDHHDMTAYRTGARISNLSTRGISDQLHAPVY